MVPEVVERVTHQPDNSWNSEEIPLGLFTLLCLPLCCIASAQIVNL